MKRKKNTFQTAKDYIVVFNISTASSSFARLRRINNSSSFLSFLRLLVGLFIRLPGHHRHIIYDSQWMSIVPFVRVDSRKTEQWINIILFSLSSLSHLFLFRSLRLRVWINHSTDAMHCVVCVCVSVHCECDRNKWIGQQWQVSGWRF